MDLDEDFQQIEKEVGGWIDPVEVMKRLKDPVEGPGEVVGGLKDPDE